MVTVSLNHWYTWKDAGQGMPCALDQDAGRNHTRSCWGRGGSHWRVLDFHALTADEHSKDAQGRAIHSQRLDV